MPAVGLPALVELPPVLAGPAAGSDSVILWMKEGYAQPFLYLGKINHALIFLSHPLTATAIAHQRILILAHYMRFHVRHVLVNI